MLFDITSGLRLQGQYIYANAKHFLCDWQDQKGFWTSSDGLANVRCTEGQLLTLEISIRNLLKMEITSFFDGNIDYMNFDVKWVSINDDVHGVRNQLVLSRLSLHHCQRQTVVTLQSQLLCTF